jgi:hypothetical protein
MARAGEAAGWVAAQKRKANRWVTAAAIAAVGHDGAAAAAALG